MSPSLTNVTSYLCYKSDEDGYVLEVDPSRYIGEKLNADAEEVLILKITLVLFDFFYGESCLI